MYDGLHDAEEDSDELEWEADMCLLLMCCELTLLLVAFYVLFLTV